MENQCRGRDSNPKRGSKLLANFAANVAPCGAVLRELAPGGEMRRRGVGAGSTTVSGESSSRHRLFLCLLSPALSGFVDQRSFVTSPAVTSFGTAPPFNAFVSSAAASFSAA